MRLRILFLTLQKTRAETEAKKKKNTFSKSPQNHFQKIPSFYSSRLTEDQTLPLQLPVQTIFSHSSTDNSHQGVQLSVSVLGGHPRFAPSPVFHPPLPESPTVSSVLQQLVVGASALPQMLSLQPKSHHEVFQQANLLAISSCDPFHSTPHLSQGWLAGALPPGRFLHTTSHVLPPHP